MKLTLNNKTVEITEDEFYAGLERLERDLMRYNDDREEEPGYRFLQKLEELDNALTPTGEDSDVSS